MACRRLVTILAVLALIPTPLAAQTRSPTLWERVGTLPIDEASGVAVSRAFPGILWVHNDSGDESRVYAVRVDGALVATFDVQGARARDWEDMALGPCPWDLRRSCLIIGDIGDNAEDRTRVVLYFVEEPDPTLPGDSARSVGPARAVRVRYADRPHDAEGLAVDPAGNVHIVTKGRTGPILRYAISREALLADSLVAVPRDTLAIVPQRMLFRWVTAAAIRPDGLAAVVKTYTEIYLYRIEGGRWVLDGPACYVGPREPQGEAIDFIDDTTFILLSERSSGEPTMFRARC